MKRLLWLTMVSLCIGFIAACGSSSTSSDDSGGGGGGTTPTASDYADFGAKMSAAAPEALRSGVASANVAAGKALSGTCATDYTDCPYITVSGGGDETSGELLMRLWGLDYSSACTSALITAGTCFTCADCQTGGYGSNFIKPTMFDTPTQCGTINTTSARYVNLGVDPCFFDSMVAQIDNVAECATDAGTSVNISTAVPWYASWGVPQSITFSGYSHNSSSGGGMWWTAIGGDAGNGQYFISLDPNWLYAGIKDVANNQFMFFGTGSPSYYAGRGEGSGINISGYAGPITVTSPTFEAIQVRDQPPYSYIERLKANGTHVWYQSWMSGDFPSTPAEATAIKDTPTNNRCVEIGTSIALSKYVPLTDCVTSFGKTSVVDLNRDSNYIFKIIDGTTAASISFSTPLTSTTASSCL